MNKREGTWSVIGDDQWSGISNTPIYMGNEYFGKTINKQKVVTVTYEREERGRGNDHLGLSSILPWWALVPVWKGSFTVFFGQTTFLLRLMMIRTSKQTTDSTGWSFADWLLCFKDEEEGVCGGVVWTGGSWSILTAGYFWSF